MSRWRPQPFQKQAEEQHVPKDIVQNAIAVAREIQRVSPALPPIFTLRHLAYLTDADYGYLRALVARKEGHSYRLFRIRKKPSFSGERRYRVIAVPSPGLQNVQSWMTQNILAHAEPHSASVAFAKGNRIVDAAAPHCSSRWLIKLDIANFFESINEVSVYRVFRSLGYEPLVAFELTRLCTRAPWHSLSAMAAIRRRSEKWRIRDWKWTIIKAYDAWGATSMGHLPQGAPTSPMLANLCMRSFDESASKIADAQGLIYTRYADDLTFSTTDRSYSHERCRTLIGKIYALMGSEGLSPNRTKARIAGPGARKIVLGLLVDGPSPRLPRDFRSTMRQHLYYLQDPEIGPASHIRARGFTSIIGFRNHLLGLVAFASQIEPKYGSELRAQLNKIDWHS